MTKSIYDHHNAAFRLVGAAALVQNGIHIGKIAFKYPSEGAGRLYCYLHIHGDAMVRGSAGGYGYDKRGAAFESAVTVLSACATGELANHPILACKDIGGLDWQTALKKQGIDAFIAV